MLNLDRVNLTFNEGTLDEKHALQDINLTMEEGEFLTIIGSNGAGKSTMMNVISGSLLPDVGDVLIGDKPVTHLPEYKRSRMI